MPDEQGRFRGIVVSHVPWHADRPLHFIDPETDDIHEVRPHRHIVATAYEQGWLPFHPEDWERVAAIRERDANV